MGAAAVRGAVVGAGPAGLAAAAELAAAGVPVHVYDENPTPRAVAGGVVLHPAAVVWGLFDGRTLAVWESDRAARVRPDVVVLATGGHDRPLPVPGWTLPGVYASGAAVPPSARVLVAGAAPHLPEVTASEVVAVVDAVAVRGARTVARVLGGHQVEGAVTIGLDADGRPVAGTEASVAADAVGFAFGRVPAIQLAVLAGCQLEYVAAAGGWVPLRSERLETTVPGVYAAGDCGGIGGPAFAETEGRIAGVAAAARLGALAPAEAAARLARLHVALAERRRERVALGRVTRVRDGLAALATRDTVLCPCEDVTAADVDDVLEEGAPDLAHVKRMTRAGMGLCQGRRCEAGLAALFVHRTGSSPATVAPLSVRPPVRPVPIDVLARLG